MQSNVTEFPITQDREWRKHEQGYREKLGGHGVPEEVIESIVADMKVFHYEVFSGSPAVEIAVPVDLGLTKAQYDWLYKAVLGEFGSYRDVMEEKLVAARELYLDQVLLRHGYRAR
ncbi:hypothetical protein [Pseudomonas putida]|uniref:hypothetical protein n=1 Tax=Pseudomonas putida TaxID=303 RepID=UPI001623D7BE|nr:hypothetical protein [Pseudomonas putida]QNG07215.1 hypothetical protein GPM17_01065 [Pseudomonas putida]HDS1059576.1 hypothetical protein [Pseudomonas putida]